MEFAGVGFIPYEAPSTDLKTFMRAKGATFFRYSKYDFFTGYTSFVLKIIPSIVKLDMSFKDTYL